MGVQVADWGIKKMKTKWGSCNVDARRIWINLELVKKPVQCLEYIVVHELVHLMEQRHNDPFMALMDSSNSLTQRPGQLRQGDRIGIRRDGIALRRSG